MVYTKNIWAEHLNTEEQKLGFLNSLETQYEETIAVALAHKHDTIYYRKTVADSTFFGVANDGASSGMDSGTIDGYSLEDIIDGSVTEGMIFFFAGKGYTMPPGWETYTSAQGRLIIGAGSSYAVKSTGGSQYTGAPATPTGTIDGHSVSEAEMPSHTHDIWEYWNRPTKEYRKNDSDAHVCYAPGQVDTNTDYAQDAASVYANGNAHTHSCTVSVNSIDHMPPYIVLQMMKKEAMVI